MKVLFSLLLILAVSFQISAQSNMQGFSYQAVIRNLDGTALANAEVDIDIELYSKISEQYLFAERHHVLTDKFGQINIVIGQGNNMEGSMDEVPWEDGNIYYKIRISDESKNLDIISEAQLLAVPYAFHSNTANSVTGDSPVTGRDNIKPGENWTVFGNKIVDGNNNFGTTDRNGINIITFDLTRIEIASNGDVFFKEKLIAEGEATFEDVVRTLDDVTIDGTLTVKQEGQFEQSITTLQDLTVEGDSYLGDELNVGGDVTFGSTFTVANMKPTLLTGTLEVGKSVKFNEDLEVIGKAIFQDNVVVNANLNVTENLDLGGNISIGGTTTLNDVLTVQKNVPDGGYVATFINSNNGNGDGINIKLGKDRTIYTPPSIPPLLTASQTEDIKNLIKCDFTGNKVTLLGTIVAEGLVADVEMIASLAVGVGNLMIGFFNSSLSLPIVLPYFVPEVEVFPGFSYNINLPSPVPDVGFGIDAVSVGPFPSSPVTIFPAIPAIDLSALGINEIAINDLSFWGVPDLCLTDAPGSTPLNNENEFVRFSDNSNQKMGSIRAVSLTDWSNNYLTPSYLFKLHGAITSAVDKKHARYHFKGELTKALEDYKSIGVEYSSGNGDYAEWLERTELTESINPGDIVGVIGGKISKDIENAEQVMVVSHNPIVLGNMPAESQVFKGNNIAFMGQVPVKVMGTVKTGDYIVASSTIPGYGIAVSPDNMTVTDFKFAVGRSWENIDVEGPKLVNTVVGLHNGDYTKVLQKINTTLNENEQRFNTLEEKVEALSKVLIN